jgi:UDP-GlcNAc:undecaprenyl-phosphate/decaprenyl-phosphate GlcNAc-1-phosphate transferase
MASSLVVSMLCCWLILATQGMHARLTSDAVTGGPQKFAPLPVPRVAGFALFLAMALTGGAFAAAGIVEASTLLLLTLVAIPAFVGGLLEDLTKKVSVGLRLRFTFLSAAIAFFVLDARISLVDLPFVDLILSGFIGCFVFSLFAVGGMAHAMNIIDGFNGLLGVCGVLILSSIAAVAMLVGDQEIFLSAAIVAGAVIGFLIFNFPRGRIFAGDGGAYLVGFVTAELAVLLVHRNSEVSPWFALTAFVYPVFETAFSMYRKRVLRGQPISKPDGIHLHMLVYRRLVRWYPGSKDVEHRIVRNALTSPYLWLLCGIGSIAAVTFWNNTTYLQLSILAFCYAYLWLYRRIVRFATPRSLIIRNPRHDATEGDPAGKLVA